MTPVDRPPCGHHGGIREILDDHEARLREKRDRLLRLEMEARHMRETMEALLAQTREIKASVDALTSTRTYILGGVAVIGVIYGLLVAHGPALLRMLGVGG